MPRLIVHTFSVSIDGFGAARARTSATRWASAGRSCRRTAPRHLTGVLGHGEHLLGGIDLPALGYECVEHRPGERASAHVVLRKVS